MNEDKIIQKLIEIDERTQKIDENIEKNMVTRSEFLTAHEEVVTFLKKLDQERIFTIEWVKRIEAEVAKIKEVLKIP
jgi:hypothetical protein